MSLRSFTRALAPPLGLAFAAACDGRGARAAAEAAANFGEAMVMVALVLLVFTAICGALYLAMWWWFIASWRRGQPSRGLAVTFVILHASALLMAGMATDEPIHAVLWWTAPLPAAALALAFAARWPARLAIAAVTAAALCLLPAEPPPVRALPSDIVELSSSFQHACVVLRGGDVVCNGSLDAGCERRSNDIFLRPTRIDALADADRVHTLNDMTCARRRAGPVTCCGGAMFPGHSQRDPWPLPIGGPTSTLLVTERQILAQTGDDLQAWPHPLPPGLGTARAIAANGSHDNHFAVVDRAGELWMWRQEGPTITELTRVPGLADAVEVAVQPRTGACVRRAGGAVACFPWPDSKEPSFEVAELRAEQLVALDDAFDSFCARKADRTVVCWEEDDPPRTFAALPTATRLVAVDGALCDVAARVRCVPTMFDIHNALATLLALPIER